MTLVDIHAHYPMHVIGDVERDTLIRAARTAGGRPPGDKLRALLLRIGSTLFSHSAPSSGYRVTVDGMRASGVRVAFSVITRPFDEAAVGRPFGSAPESRYFAGVLRDLEAVEAEVAAQPAGAIRVAHDRAELDAAMDAGAVALVHALEGGFSLGDGVEEIEDNVAELARRGVVYVTLAHLLPRQVAASCSAFPFLTDGQYRLLFRQRRGEGLTERGEAAVRAMARHRVMLDVSHMRRDALDEAFALLDELDPAAPVLATHAGYRFGRQEYMLTDETIRRISRRNGLIGIILAQHQLNDGLRRRRTRTLDESLQVVFRHIDRIAEVAGGYEQIAIGTDFDGFIKPTMAGLGNMAELARLEAALGGRYGRAAELMTSSNALRVLRYAWPAARVGAATG
jgi:microsomal dipeptidase-like Zn-dependent dipeptidase